jgi:hypothetical protein
MALVLRLVIDVHLFDASDEFFTGWWPRYREAYLVPYISPGLGYVGLLLYFVNPMDKSPSS